MLTEAEIRALVDKAAAEAAARAAKEVAREAAKVAVHETLIAIGIDAKNPLEAQADAQFTRDLRQSFATVKKQGIVTAIGILTAALFGLIWMAIKSPVS